VKKLAFILALLALPVLADGPQFVGPNDKTIYSEFQNSYYDIKNAPKKSSTILGTRTNDSAITGHLGEYVECTSVGTVSASATGVMDDLCSISLTSGDWDVSAIIVFYNSAGSATWTDINAGISATSGNSFSGLTVGVNRIEGFWGSTSTNPREIPFVIPSFRVSLNTTTTYYLKRYFEYSAGTPVSLGGRISARRVR
jgi:hypothetical protein